MNPTWKCRRRRLIKTVTDNTDYAKYVFIEGVSVCAGVSASQFNTKALFSR